MRKRIAIVAAVVVALGGGAAAVYAHGRAADAGSVATTTVGAGPIEATVSATGNLVPLQQLTLDFPNPGRLVEVNAKQGDMVTKGQVLAKIDDRAAQDELARAMAAADDANVRLSRDGPSSSDLTADRLAVATTSAELHAAQRALDDTSLVAPIDALVNMVSNRPGELVGAAPPSAGATSTAQSSSGGGFIVLSDISALPVRAAFSEADSARIKQGQTAQVTFDALPGRTIDAKVDSVLATPTVVNNVVTYPVTVAFALFAGARPGMTANVAVVVDKRDVALVVPNAAIATVGEFTEVVVVNGSHQAYRQVKLGAQGDSVSEVLSGLQPGERILDKPVAHEADGDVIPPPVPTSGPKASK